MQKLLKRTAQAEKQVARRKAKRNDIKARAEAQLDFRNRMHAVNDINKALVAARKRRREDWELGALAPRRDTPLKDANGAFWGSTSLTRTMTELGERQRELACQWAGGAKYLCLKAGDRVAIMQGPDKGKIGAVKAISINKAQVTLDGDHLKTNVTLSDGLADAGHATGHDAYTHLSELRVPIHAVRLVHPLRDPATGRVRDAVIAALRPVRVVRDRPTGRTTWARVVPGLGVAVPWPRAHEAAERAALARVHPARAADTPRAAAAARTAVPALLRPPMPRAVLDELRNRFSRFRTRHEPAYVARKEADAAAAAAAAAATAATPPAMRTPLQELNAKLREERRALGEPVLSDAMLVRLGEYMFKAQQAKKKGVVEELKHAQVPAPAQRVKKVQTLEDRLRYMSKKRRAKEEPRLRARYAKEERLKAEAAAAAAALQAEEQPKGEAPLEKEAAAWPALAAPEPTLEETTPPPS